MWDAFSDDYSKHLEPTIATVGRYIHHSIHLERARQVIECGCGPGLLSKALAAALPAGASLLATDYSTQMVQLAKSQLAGLKNVDVRVANACDLKEMKSGSFDRYCSNMALQIVPDPDAMLREAARVLGPGGIAGFTVWGLSDIEHSPMFSILPRSLEELGIKSPSPPQRDNFHLGQDDRKLRERVRSAGFDGAIVLFHAPAIAEAASAEEWMGKVFLGPSATRLLAGLAAEQREKLRATVLAKAKARLAEGKAICLDSIVIIACKAEAPGSAGHGPAASEATDTEDS